ncbi:hypothetical protein BJP36_41615 [Moorena producens JHB]|uniref:Uncharacterized protein n=1 Tax=Moorena producens (strain JHB) TaxID=1454205 RepID=A0A9Q9SSL7_MOOP1|nr:hypothetical protein [Moorena producens]WAN68863.1 hypothetical protein BJP36_41615 [Moorena producens JHB]
MVSGGAGFGYPLNMGGQGFAHPTGGSPEHCEFVVNEIEEGYGNLKFHKRYEGYESETEIIFPWIDTTEVVTQQCQELTVVVKKA